MDRDLALSLLVALIMAAAPAIWAGDASGKYVNPDDHGQSFELRTEGTWKLTGLPTPAGGVYEVEGDSVLLHTQGQAEVTLIKLTPEGLAVPSGDKPWPKTGPAGPVLKAAPPRVIGKYSSGSAGNPNITELRANGTWATIVGGQTKAIGSYTVAGNTIFLAHEQLKEAIPLKIDADKSITGPDGKKLIKLAADLDAIPAHLPGRYAPAENPEEVLELKPDGTWTGTRAGVLEAGGNYTLEGDIMTMTVPGQKDSIQVKVTAAGIVAPSGKIARRIAPSFSPLAPSPAAAPATPSPAPATPASTTPSATGAIPPGLLGKYPEPRRPQSILELKADGTWTSGEEGRLQQSGTFTVQGDIVTLTPAPPSHSVSMRFTAEGLFPPGATKPAPKAK